jgi:hypothetical protein
VLESDPGREALYPSHIEFKSEECDEWNQVRFRVEEILVSVTRGVDTIEIIIQGELPNGILERITEEVRANVEAALKRQCILQTV